jgi:hypothetical protein
LQANALAANDLHKSFHFKRLGPEAKTAHMKATHVPQFLEYAQAPILK